MFPVSCNLAILEPTLALFKVPFYSEVEPGWKFY
jgi:hypothetical protein